MNLDFRKLLRSVACPPGCVVCGMTCLRLDRARWHTYTKIWTGEMVSYLLNPTLEFYTARSKPSQHPATLHWKGLGTHRSRKWKPFLNTKTILLTLAQRKSKGICLDVARERSTFFFREKNLHDRRCNINFVFSILIWQGRRPKLGPPLGKHSTYCYSCALAYLHIY